MLQKIHSREDTLLLHSDTLYLPFIIVDRRLTISELAEFHDVLNTPLH